MVLMFGDDFVVFVLHRSCAVSHTYICYLHSFFLFAIWLNYLSLYRHSLLCICVFVIFFGYSTFVSTSLACTTHTTKKTCLQNTKMFARKNTDEIFDRHQVISIFNEYTHSEIKLNSMVFILFAAARWDSRLCSNKLNDWKIIGKKKFHLQIKSMCVMKLPTMTLDDKISRWQKRRIYAWIRFHLSKQQNKKMCDVSYSLFFLLLFVLDLTG